jgi:hypothetical protein
MGLFDWFRRRRPTPEQEARLARITNPQQRAALLKAVADGDVIPEYAWDPLPTEFDTFAFLPRAPQAAASSNLPVVEAAPFTDTEREPSELIPLTNAVKAREDTLGPRTNGWRRQYDRMKRAYARAQTAIEMGEQTVDDYYSFFVWCYHLKDWLKNDETVPPAVRALVEAFVKERRALAISGDIANGVKHLLRDERRARVDPNAKVSAIPPAFQKSAFQGNAFQTEGRVVVVVDGNHEDAGGMAQVCVAAWDDFLRIHSLLISEDPG